MPHRLVRGSEKGLRLAGCLGVVFFQGASCVDDEEHEAAECERGASGEPRREDDEKHDERRELQHCTELGENP